MEAFEKEFAKGATASGLYHVAKHWYKRGMLHAAEITSGCDNSCPNAEIGCLACRAKAIRKEAGE